MKVCRQEKDSDAAAENFARRVCQYRDKKPVGLLEMPVGLKSRIYLVRVTATQHIVIYNHVQ